MSGADIKSLYSKRYSNQTAEHLYPAEFVVRAFLGTYPQLKLAPASYKGKAILDLGYGDGRNMPLLRNLGFRIHGVEIDEAINATVAKRLKQRGLRAVLKQGTNAAIPFDAETFDFVLACHSCYYVEDGSSFKKNLWEIARVMKDGGTLICSLPMRDTYILKNATGLGNGHWKVTTDPYGLRAGVILRAFENKKQVVAALRPHFRNVKVGFCDDYYWGIRQKVWIVVCEKR